MRLNTSFRFSEGPDGARVQADKMWNATNMTLCEQPHFCPQRGEKLSAAHHSVEFHRILASWRAEPVHVTRGRAWQPIATAQNSITLYPCPGPSPSTCPSAAPTSRSQYVRSMFLSTVVGGSVSSYGRERWLRMDNIYARYIFQILWTIYTHGCNLFMYHLSVQYITVAIC